VVGSADGGRGSRRISAIFLRRGNVAGYGVETWAGKSQVSVVAWTDIGQTLPNAYLYAAQELGGGGNSNQSAIPFQVRAVHRF